MGDHGAVEETPDRPGHGLGRDNVKISTALAFGMLLVAAAYTTNNLPTIATAAAAADTDQQAAYTPTRDCTSYGVPKKLAVWCGTFTGEMIRSGNFSGLDINTISRKPDGSIVAYGVYRWKNGKWILDGYGRVATVTEEQLTIMFPDGAKSTYTFRDSNTVEHWFCKNAKKRCLGTSHMGILKRVD